MKQSHWLLYRRIQIAPEKKNGTIKPDSNVTTHRMKTYSESRIELRDLEILKKKCWQNLVNFCHRSSPVRRKAHRAFAEEKKRQTTASKCFTEITKENNNNNNNRNKKTKTQK